MAEKRFFYGWWIALGSLIINIYLGGAFFYSFTAFFEPIVEEFQWSYFAISLAASLRSLEMGIAAPLTGFLADRWGPRRLILSGVLITSAGAWMLSRTSSLATFYASFLLIAVGISGLSSPVQMTAVANWFRKKAGLAMGLVSAGWGAGGAMVLPVVWLIDSYQWRTTMVILGVGMLAIGIPISLVFRHKPEQYGLLPDGQAATAAPEPRPWPESETAREVAAAPGREFTPREALKTSAFWLIALAGTIQTMVAGGVFVHVMPYLSSIGVARHQAALVAMLIPVVSIAGRLGLSWLGDILDKRAVLAMAIALQTAGMFLFAHVQTPWLLIPFLVTFAPGYGGFIPVRTVIQREYFGRSAFGTIQGITMGLFTAGHIIGPTLAGRAFDVTASYRQVWLGYALLTGLALPLVLAIKPPVKGKPQALSR